jgi:hypothetical protein
LLKRLSDGSVGQPGGSQSNNWEENVSRVFREPPVDLRQSWNDSIRRGVMDWVKSRWAILTVLITGPTIVSLVAWHPEILMARSARLLGAISVGLAVAYLLARFLTSTLRVRHGVHVLGLGLHLAFFFLLFTFVQGATPRPHKPWDLDLAPLQLQANELASRVEDLGAQVAVVSGKLGPAAASAGEARRTLDEVEKRLQVLAVELKSQSKQSGKPVGP